MERSLHHHNTVLVVEDEPLLRMLATEFLNDAGFETLSAADADEAVAILERVPDIGVVFSDIDMPGSMNGLRMAMSIHRRWPTIGVLLASGRAAPSMHDLQGGTAFLQKPYSEGEVIETLRRLAA